MRRRVDWPLMFGLCAWNAEKDWTGTLAGMDGFKRGKGSRGLCEDEASSSVLRGKGRSIVLHDPDPEPV